MNRIFASFFVLGLVLSSAQVSFAQESEPAQPAVPSPQAVGPLNCYDFYTYGSVEADLKPTVKQTVPGTPITFVGNLKNTNPYPLLDGTLYVKIFKRDETTFSAGDVDFVVDQFVIKDGITLRANGQERTTFVWEVPRNAEAGNYYAAYFFTTAKRYNLMGLSFTDDIVGNQAPFAITAPDAVPVAKLLKSDTTLNGETNLFAGYPLSFSADEAVTISTTLINNSAVAKTLPLQWNQYAWDSMNKDNLRRTKTEVVTIPPKSEKTVTYTAQKQSESVVYVTAVTQDIETKSFLNVRYGHDGIPETRTNFLGLSAFPLAKDTPATLFACAQSTNLPLVPGNILTLSLKDRAGKTIHEYRYEGDIKGTTGGFGESFTPASNINFATLTATLERDGVVIEEVTQTYDCEAIDPVTCFPEEGMGGFLDFLKTYYLPLILTLVIILLIAAIMVYLKKRPRREHIDAGTSNTAFLFLLLFLPSLFFFNSDAVNAQACMVGSQHNIDFLGVDGEGNNGGETGIQGDARCQVRTYVEEGSYVACDYEQRPYTVSPVGRCLSGVRFLPSPQDAAQCYIQGFDCADVGSCGGSGDTEFWGGGFNSSDCSPMFVTCQPGQRAYFDTRETERQCPGFVGRSHIGIIGRCIADASCTASSGNLCTATPQETYIAGQCNDWGYTQLISKYQGNDGYQLWENATDQGTNTGECVQIKPAQVGNEVLSAWKASSCTAPTSCGPIGYQAYTAEEFRNLSLQCQAEGFTVLSESANEPEGGQLADLGKTQGCLVTRDLNPGGPFGGGYQYAWYTNPSASCTAPPTGGSCTWTRKFQDAFDGWVTDVYARCQSRFQFFASTKPLCSSVGVIEGASATGSESNCLPYTSGNDACGEFTNIQSYEFDQLAPAGPGCVAQTSCTQEFNSARWYTGGTSVPISSEGLSQPNNCARDAQDQGYTHWNRSVRHDSTQEDPYVTNCFGVSNPTGTESKLQVVTYRDGATITITTGFDSGSSCTASPTNRAPNAPTINGQGNGGSTNGVVNLDVNLAFLATDPDSDNILYGIDWDNTGEDPDQWLPGDRTLVPSGTVLSTNRSYLSDGTYTFRALAVDSNGNRSGWTSHTINVGSPITQCSYDIVSNCVEGRCNDLHTVRTSFGSGQAETIDVWDQFTIEAIVGGVRQTLVTRCDAEFPGFGNCMATQSFTINGHALSVDVLASFTPSGINSSEMRGTGDVQNCTYQGISADLKINDSTGPLTVTRGTPLDIEWSSTNAASCSAFWLPGAPTVATTGNDSQLASMSMQYLINCGGELDTVEVIVEDAAGEPIAPGPADKPNFTDLIINYTPSTGFNPTTGEYDSVTVNFQTINLGLSGAPSGANYEFQFDRGGNGYDLTTHGSMGSLAINDIFRQTEVVPGPIVFGDSSVRVYVDYQDVVDETDDTPADNERILPLVLPPPNPNIDISADRLLVRSGEKVTLTWNTRVTYPMSCRVFGPGITTVNFDPSINGATGSKPSEPIKAKSEFTISCMVAGTTFTDSVIIETQGVIEEI